MIVQLATEPAMFAQAFADNFNTGDLDQVLSYYTADAVMNLGVGNVFCRT